jgi:hypothetical protein
MSTHATRKGPRSDSRAYFALQQLHGYGGCMAAKEWTVAVAWKEALGIFDRQVIAPLLLRGLIIKRGADLAITGRGKAFIGAADPVAELVITPATYVPPMRPLSAKYRPGLPVIREGAFDYRGIPSLQAGQRTAFQTSFRVKNG